MQVRNDYGSFQNRNYQESHTHHITECLHEEQVKKRGGAGAGQQSLDKSGGVEFSKDGDIYQMNIADPITKKASGKSGSGFVKGFWEVLGDESTENNKNVMAVLKESLLSGIHGAATAIKDTVQHQITGRLQELRGKIKINAGSALKRFGRNKDAFTALTGGQTPSERGKYNAKEKNRNGQVTASKKEEDIPMKVLTHSHLMDSYNKRGEYSQLNDNLTYQKPKSISKEQTGDRRDRIQ